MSEPKYLINSRHRTIDIHMSGDIPTTIDMETSVTWESHTTMVLRALAECSLNVDTATDVNELMNSFVTLYPGWSYTPISLVDDLSAVEDFVEGVDYYEKTNEELLALGSLEVKPFNGINHLKVYFCGIAPGGRRERIASHATTSLSQINEMYDMHAAVAGMDQDLSDQEFRDAAIAAMIALGYSVTTHP